MRAVTAETMQSLDRRTIEDYGIPGLELMERAGTHVAGIIQARFGKTKDNSAIILAGKGNNGGDGFVVARLLVGAGWQVTLLLFAGADSLRGDALTNYTRLPSSVMQRHFQELSNDEARHLIGGTAVIIDALFGTGLTTGLSGIYADAVRLVNSSARPVVAVDIPSGIDATTGRTPGEAVKADITVTFAAAKIGQCTYPGAGYVGELIVTDIGIPAELLGRAPYVEIIDREYAAGLLQLRPKTAHKGSCGHCLVIAGSTGKSGAATMAANSAMRSGAGLVTLAVPAGIHAVAEVKTTEVMTLPLAETACGSIALESLGAVKKLLAERDAAAVGPGLGGHSETVALVREIICATTLPLVLDADALNALGGDLSPLNKSASSALILTPHPGEMARLCGATVAEIESDRLERARSFAVANK